MKGHFKKHFLNLLKKHCPLNTHSKSLKPQANKHFKISLLKTCFISALCLNSALADNIYSLPSTLNLNAQQQKSDTAIGTKGNGTMWYFYDGKGANFTLNGGVGSKYTLSSNNQATMFSVDTLTLGANANLELNQFHTLAVNTALSLGANSTFSATNSGMVMSAGGTEYGGDSKLRFEKNSRLVIGNSASASFSRILFFIHKGDISLGANSRLDMPLVLRAVRFEKSFTNNGGTMVLGSSQLSTRVYNVGNYSVATFTQNSGATTIYGDFYNGGDVREADNAVDTTGSVAGGFNVYDTAYSGGGDLVLNGGTMHITGKLVSAKNSFGTVYNPNIKIYGATLIVNGGLQNKEGSTITFGIGSNSQMGQFQGALQNENGVVAVDIKGMNAGQSYQIIKGTASGLSGVSLVGANSQYFTATYNSGSVIITKNGDPLPPDPSPPTPDPDPPTPDPTPKPSFDDYKSSLNPHQKGILNALSLKFGSDDKLLLSGIDTSEATLNDTNKAIKDGVIASPKGMINAFKGDTLLAPFGKGFETKRLAATELIRFDNGRRVKAIQAKPSRDFYLSPVGAVLKANDTSGYVAGFTLGTNYKMQNFTNRVYLSYAYGAARQDLATQSTDTKAHLFQIGTMSRYKLDILETDINANFLLGDFKINNEWQEALLSSTSKFANYQLGFGLTAGARLGERLSIKPFAGIQNYLEMQEGFTSILGFESKSYNAYILDGILGVEGHYKFNEFASVYGKFSFESRLYNSHKHLFLRVGSNELEYENKGYDNAINAHLGTQILTYKRFKLDIEGLFRHYNTGLNYYGGSLIFRYGIN